jgi:hypothetical protein
MSMRTMHMPPRRHCDVRHPASMRYDRHSSRSWGASAFRGSYRMPNGSTGVNVLRSNKGTVSHKLDGHALGVEQVDTYDEELGQVELRG